MRSSRSSAARRRGRSRHARSSGQAADHRGPGHGHGFGWLPMDYRGFAQRLREHGWIEGRTVAIEYRWADGRPSASPRSPPSSCGSRSMSSSPRAAPSCGQAGDIGHPDRLCDRRTTLSPPACCSLCAAGRQRHWIIDPRGSISPASGSSSCAKFVPGSSPVGDSGQRRYPIRCWRWARFRQRPASLASRSPN